MSRARAVAAGLLAGLLVHGPGAAAADVATPRGTVERLSQQVAADIAARATEGPLAVFVSSPSPELSRALTTLTVAELSRRGLGGMSADAPDAAAAESRARDAGARALARVTVVLDRGMLSARGDLLGTWVNFWSGRSPTRPPQPAAMLEAATEVDAHALALLAVPIATRPPADAAPAKVQVGSAVLARLPSAIAALAAGDLDRDGVEEVVAVTDDEVVVLAADGRVLARRDTRALAPAASPVRDSIACAAVVQGQGQVAYFHARKARGELLAYSAGSLRVVRELDEAPAGKGNLWGKWVPGQNVLAPELKRWSAPAPFHSISVFEGAARTDAVVVMPGGAGAWVRGFPGTGEALAGVGAGTALFDLDGDGAPELATTSAAYAPEMEEVRVFADAPWGVPPKWQVPIGRGRAMAAAAARLDRERAQQLLVGMWLPDGNSEVLVIRRVAP